jgi:Zn-dependent protease/predicted transcriptional regulator
MFGHRVSLFKIFGFEVKLDASWVILAVLVTWTLAAGVFPYYYKNLPVATYWWMGLAGAIGLFASIVIHELFHSLVARKYGMPMKGITLFIFGGVAEMEEEPPSARAEFFMAIAGPITTIILGMLFYVIYRNAYSLGWPVALVGIFNYLRWINFLLAAFNLLPAFPLDGGRVLRSLLWSWKGNIGWATRVSAQIGSGFGFAMIFIGILRFIGGAFVGGMWFFLIGLFLRNAARVSYQRLLTMMTLQGEQVRRFMNKDPMTIPPSITVSELVEDYVYKHHYKMFPVVEDGKLKGCVSTREIKEVPREEWSARKAGELMKPCSSGNTVAPGDDATRALSLMNKTGSSRLMVVQDGKLVGIVALKDMLRFFSLKMELEGEDVGHGHPVKQEGR